MGLIDGFVNFLETQLDEYIRSNPHMELTFLEEELQRQMQEVDLLIAQSQRQEQADREKILAIAEDIRLWHQRAGKAEVAQRGDLAAAAREREAQLLHQGNQVWAAMELNKKRLAQTQELREQIHLRRQEVQQRLAAMPPKPTPSPAPASSPSVGMGTAKSSDDLDAVFQRWETEEELRALKRKMGM
ncbi:MAG: TIGR04376 family protein [Oscillatoriales cyanobacterium SM2_2_1]|nr:TIGR04376 family protein [Oscillatoriales cyanobacterium SM2_2_1]